MKGVILQPTYLPWLGYFEMVAASDVFIILDHVQFERKSWQQKNRIKTADGEVFLHVPVQKMPLKTPIHEIKISYQNGNFLEKHLKSIEQSYKKAPYFKEYKPILEKIYLNKYVLLRDLNVEIIKSICGILGIKKKILLSSEMDLKDEKLGKTEKLVNLCKMHGITNFYEGKSGEMFIDKSLFQKENIKVSFQNFIHPKYNQLWGEFVPNLSIIDLILNEGKNSLNIIRS